MLKRMVGCFAVVAIAVLVAMQQPVGAQTSADFDGDGTVGFSDFLEFAGQFGAQRGDGRYQAKYDLNSDGAIDFADFLLFAGSYGQSVPPLETVNKKVVFSFAGSYGQSVPPSGGGGSSGGGSGGSGGGSSSPDLIVESPSVSDSTLTPGQSFTLRATVRNRGTGQSASTTLTYYRSTNSTISTSDTEVGTDSVSGLSASRTGSESIRLTAPSSTGTYYYGACVRAVSGETDTRNNCSTGVRVTVSRGGDSEIVEIPDANLRAVISDSLNKARGAPITRADMATLTRINARNYRRNVKITDLTGLEFATNLRRLNLQYNRISDIAALAGLTNLTVLYLGGNQLSDSDIATLVGLTNLTVLYLDGNQISYIIALSGLTNLRTLHLGRNRISDITALSGLTNLTSLWLLNNRISDIAALAGLTNLTWLDLSDNPLSDISRNGYIPILRARGVAVSF